jgi:hypothetical protein
MAVTSTQSFSYRLVANGEGLDLFRDEDVFLSDNITGLFDLGTLPSDFTQQILLPGTKNNNAFFEHVYDISVQSPYLFETNKKVNCYLDFGSLYLANGYLQLNKVNVLENKFIDSYDVTIYGSLSSFARELNRAFLTDLDNLAIYNHTSSIQNITGSWEGNLFDGDIVYPLIDYGQRYEYTPENPFIGIDSPAGAITVQDYKPAIRARVVWDAIFDKYGFTYTGSFFEQTWLDNVYLVCNNQLKYPVYDTIDLESYGLFRISPISGSGQTDITLNANVNNSLPWFKIESNPTEQIDANLNYDVEFNTKLRGRIGINFRIETTKSSGTTIAGNGVPQFDLVITGSASGSIVPLTSINNEMINVLNYNETITRDQTFTLVADWTSSPIPSGSYNFNIKYSVVGDSNFSIVLNPNNSVNSFLEVTKVNQAGDRLVLDIPSNMPFGETGVKLIDFVTSIQKKFNLIIYPSKTKPNEFIVETFNDWYKKGKIRDFNKYINLDNPIEVIPANNLAVNELNFGDTLDKDYLSKEFNDLENREYGKTYFVDTENFYSQGKFEVQTSVASSPLFPIVGTGASGSLFQKNATFIADATATAPEFEFVSAETDINRFTTNVVTAFARAFNDETKNVVNQVISNVIAGDQIVFFATADGQSSPFSFTKQTDSGTTTLSSGTLAFPGATTSFIYIVTVADTTSDVLIFRSNIESETF